MKYVLTPYVDKVGFYVHRVFYGEIWEEIGEIFPSRTEPHWYGMVWLNGGVKTHFGGKHFTTPKEAADAVHTAWCVDRG